MLLLSYKLSMKQCSMTSSFESESGFNKKIKACLIHDFEFLHVVEAFITLN